MRKIKKFAALLLALVMAAALAAPALAVESSGTNADVKGQITVTNPNTEGETTYSIYKIFDLVSYDNNTDAAIYKIETNSPWYKFVTEGAGKGFVTVDADGYVSEAQGEAKTLTVQEFAAAVKAFITADDGATLTPAAQKSAPNDIEDGKIVFSDLELGYYVLYSSNTEALCSLDTTNNQIDVTEKRPEPTVDKAVEENSTPGTYGETNDASIGDRVNYRITVNLGQNLNAVTDPYILHDMLSAGLTFGSIDSVVLSDGTALDNDDYEVNTTPTKHDIDGKEWECDFEITFSADWVAKQADGAQVFVYYHATLNEDAKIGGEGNPNDTILEYGNEKYTEKDQTKTYTYEFDLVKTNADKILIAGAEFQLYRQAVTADGTDLDRFAPENLTTFEAAMKDEDNNWYVYKVKGFGSETTEDEAATIEVKDGKVIIRGLDAGTYYLKETAAPNGYNMVADAIEVTLTATDDKTSVTLSYDGQTNVDNDATVTGTAPNMEWGSGGVRVVNQRGALLPSTGGIGTTIFYIVGGVLAVGAVVLLITKRRVGSAGEE